MIQNYLQCFVFVHQIEKILVCDIGSLKVITTIMSEESEDEIRVEFG